MSWAGRLVAVPTAVLCRLHQLQHGGKVQLPPSYARVSKIVSSALVVAPPQSCLAQPAAMPVRQVLTTQNAAAAAAAGVVPGL
jgi:hypothetical protein